ncbi:Cell surface mannoprotein MP65 [Penicillium oxalicum]|uniref:Cell surface mannoprotein MP65 n=1 Tax=Penicillium oxalicum TaxID=69781 RepID=UPI0020B709AF|nr:Cell surface mannoprotein MP65 [Penicillium oxalicum]KAI2795119.1 Cell surface mannoprotein MP65 [Penicillium oxalicum]
MKQVTKALLALQLVCGRVFAQDRGPSAHCPDGSYGLVWDGEHGLPNTGDASTRVMARRQMTSIEPPSPASPLQPDNAWLASPSAPPACPEGPDLLLDDSLFGSRLLNRPGRPPVQQPNPVQHPGPDQHAMPSHQFGISYSPYRPDRSCKTQQEIKDDISKLTEYPLIRIYGTDCGQTVKVARAAREHKKQVFAGVYELADLPNTLKEYKEAASLPDGGTDWSIFHTIAVGNELVNSGMASPADVIGALNQARTILRRDGYKGPIVTVDTFSVLLKHPELCIASDYCAANCHAFFDATQHASNAGPYVLEQAHAVSAAAGGKHTMITESGWPHAGDPNGAAVPSPENQRVALDSLRRSFSHREGDLVLFTAYDDMWKKDNQYTFNAERFWGMY